MCQGFGIDGRTAGIIVAGCVVLAPVALAVAAPAALIYCSVVAGAAAVEKADEKVQHMRTTNLLRKIKNRFVKRLKAGDWQAYLQEVYDRTQSDPSGKNLKELGIAMLCAEDAVKAEEYLSAALAKLKESICESYLPRDTPLSVGDKVLWKREAESSEEQGELVELTEKGWSVRSGWGQDYYGLSTEIPAKQISAVTVTRSEGCPSVCAMALFARGLANQTLKDYAGAAEDFRLAAEYSLVPTPGDCTLCKEGASTEPSLTDAPKLPTLTYAECLNSQGYSLYLRACYSVMQSRDFARLGTEMALSGHMPLLPDSVLAEVKSLARARSTDVRGEMARQLLDEAKVVYDAAIEATVANPRGMFIFNRGKAKYYLALLSSMQAFGNNESEGKLRIVLSPSERSILEDALVDFQACVQLENFGTTAEGYAMQAQTLAILGRSEEAAAAKVKAFQLDPKTFLIDLASEEQLITPWPLPPMTKSGQVHEFEERRFCSPHFCDHCLKIVPSIKMAMCCTRCEFLCHTSCAEKVKDHKVCWAAQEEASPTSLRKQLGLMQGGDTQAPDAHVHRMTYVHFHKPTWCDACGQFAYTPWGYRCSDCRFRVHVDCLDNVKCIIQESM